ncbi:hypothetical protein GOA89_11560 [Sinorhizobium meliloti]|nr:hypothetical protein [Sinorhizobium meliloti]MDW9846939.1 hypothetical protein [Sinorhizobium meliloti]MDX0143743.1 hypothetical protein [Sinorhizobium meliloti]MDX0149768.1 hypothetical protein [Sinorhizobium meliloti]MDX0168957.1 hypothetical protein [Sinorhizobium meliloti]
MAEIIQADEDHFARFYHGMQVTGRWIGRAMVKGRLVAGFGGLIETEAGEWIAFFEVPEHERKPSVLRHIKAAFAEAKEQGAKVIKATCDTSIPRAEALMRHLGFEPTDETLDDKVVWAWRK